MFQEGSRSKHKYQKCLTLVGKGEDTQREPGEKGGCVADFKNESPGMGQEKEPIGLTEREAGCRVWQGTVSAVEPLSRSKSWDHHKGRADLV